MTTIKKYYWAMIPLVGWVVVRFCFNFNGLYGQDAYAYLLHAREWRSFFLGGATPGAFFWPPNYSIVTAVLGLAIRSEFLAAQLVSLLSVISIAWLLDRWISQAYQAHENLRIGFVVIAFLASPYMFRLGVQSMSDMLAMAFLTASFYHLWLFLQSNATKAIVLWSVFSALAITTRYPAIVVLFPSIVFVFFKLMNGRQYTTFFLALLIGLIPVSAAIFWKQSSGGMENVLSLDLIRNWSVLHLFQTEFTTSDNNTNYLLPNLLFNLSTWVHPGTLFFGVLLLPFSFSVLRKDQFRILLLFSIFIYAIFLSGIPFQNTRVATFTYPPLVVFFFQGFIKLVDRLRSKANHLSYLFFVVLFIQIGLCVKAMVPSIASNRFEQQLARWIEGHHPQKTVYTSSYSQLFDVYRTGNPVVQIYDNELTTFQNNSVFIFNGSWAEFKLKGTIPLRNWETANRLMRVDQDKCWPEGWCTYNVYEK